MFEDRCSRRAILRSAGPPRMPPWPSSTCAPTPNSPSSTAPCASTTWWPPRRRDGQAALAITDLSQPVRRRQVLQRGAQDGRQADHRRRRLAGARRRRQAGRAGCCCWCRTAGLPEPVRAAVARLDASNDAARRRPGCSWDWLGELGDGLIALSGAELGAVGQALLAGDARARRAARAAPGRRCSRSRFYIELQRAGLPTQRGACARRRAAGGRARPAGGGHAPGAVPRARRLRGARGARLRRRGRDAGQPEARQALQPRAVLQDARRRWRRCSPTCPRRWPTRWRSRGAAT